MGNVAGIGQFLETVGVPGPQVGAQTGVENGVPGQDFAAAMQQAGGPVVRPAPSGQQEEEVAAANGANTKVVNGAAQGGSVKAADQGKLDMTAQPETNRPSLAAQPRSSARVFGVGAGIFSNTGVGSKPVFTSQSVFVSAGSAAKSTVLTSTESSPEWSTGAATGETTTAMSLSGTQNLAITSAAMAAPNELAVLESAAAAAGALKSGGTTVATGKASQEAVAGSTKATAKAGVSAESKLTAPAPQGTVVAAQDAAVVSPVQIPMVPMPQTVPDAVSSAASKPAGPGGNDPGRTVLVAAVDEPLAGTAPAAILRGAGGQGPSAQTAGSGSADASGSAALTGNQGTLTAGNTSANVGTVAGQAESAASLTRAIQAPAELLSKPGSASPGPAAPVPNLSAGTAAAAQAVGDQRSAAIEATPEQVSAVSSAVSQVGRTLPTAALKASARGTVATAKIVSDAVAGSTATSVDASMGAKATNLVAESSKAAPTSAAAPPLAAGAVPASQAASTKVRDTVVAPAQSVQASGTLPAKAEASADGDASAPAAKAVKEAVFPVAVQPTAVEPVVGLATGVPMPATHELVPGTFATGSATGAAAISGATGMDGSLAGTQELGGAGLSHTTLSATPTSLEVGVSGGTHGWLKIRAELNATGEVNASLTGATPAAMDRLRGELPALNNYLQGEKLTMGTLDVRVAQHAIVAAAESGATFSQTGSGQSGAHQGGGNQGGSGQGQAGAAANANAGNADPGSADGQRQQGGATVPALSGATGVDEVVLGRVSDTAISGDQIELGDSAGLSSVVYGAGGGRLNVRA